MMSVATRYFVASGKVQNVMFRQTVMRAAENRGLKAGATNLPDKTVSFTLSGANDKITEIVSFMQKGEAVNSWGAKVVNLQENTEGQPIEDHEVNTTNVNEFNWNPNVKMYL